MTNSEQPLDRIQADWRAAWVAQGLFFALGATTVLLTAVLDLADAARQTSSLVLSGIALIAAAGCLIAVRRPTGIGWQHASIAVGETLLFVGALTATRPPSTTLDLFFLPLLYAVVFLPASHAVAHVAIVAAMMMGSATVVDGPISTARLIVSFVVVSIGGISAHLIAQRRRDPQWDHLTFGIDPLTGLRNKESMLGSLATEIKRSRRMGTSVTVFAVDLDAFASVNERLGVEVGDEILKAVGTALNKTVREYEFAARIGDDDFIVFAAQREFETAGKLAERLRAAAELECLRLGRIAAPTVTIAWAKRNSRSKESAEHLVMRSVNELERQKIRQRTRHITPAHAVGEPVTGIRRPDMAQ